MASPTAHAPHSGPVDQPGEGAYLWARSGLARSATTRSNYVSVSTAIDWIIRNTAGNIISTTDLSDVILHDSLRVTQAINDEPDTCSFTLAPQTAPGLIPKTGDEIRISWAPGAPPVFQGYVLVTQADWRVNNLQPPWIAVQCQDPLWRFDARIVNYRFPAQSVSESIAFLVKWFCNVNPTVPGPLDFSLAFVQAGMPSLPAFDVVNQRPSTVMRTLTASVGGGFYLEGLVLHAWATTTSEPNQTNPQPLTVGLKTLHRVRRSEDATQVRRRVLVEGRRTSTLIALPAAATLQAMALGVPLQDATIFPLPSGPGILNLTRVGTQWMWAGHAIGVTATTKNPPQTKVNSGFLPGPYPNYLWCDQMPMTPPPQGWVRVGNQYSRYESILGNPLTENFRLFLPDPAYAYGIFTTGIEVGETVEWVDAAMFLQSYGLGWGAPNQTTPGDPDLRAHPTDTPVVTLAVAQMALDRWPPLEGFVQDGRYAYAGAQARADSDLADFKDPLISLDWETDDLNAIPGRAQVVALASDTIAIDRTVTILRVEITFPLRTLPPRRRCTGGYVKPSNFLDLVVTTQN
ncbi:MAG TPA: hypothetical protein VE200_10240 [Xanthobacteraceae bacterium]|nr:hypothetical protein [Xanthobacteraceae bacterium]